MPPLSPPVRLRRLAAALACAAAPACADPGYYVVTAYDNAGVRFVDLRYWTVKPRGGAEVVWPEIGFGGGVNSRWTTLLYVSGIGPSNLRTRLSTINWQNDVLLTQGEWPLDVAIHTQWIRAPDAGTTAFEFGPVLQTDVDRTQLNANLFFERVIAGPRRPTQLKYQWQVRHRWRPGLHLGAQGFGELGPWDEWAAGDLQSHRAGPAVFGTAPLGDGRRIQMQAAWLVGKTYAQRGHMFSARAAIEF